MTAGLALIGALFTASFIVYSARHADDPQPMANLLFAFGGLMVFSAYAILMSYYTNRLFGPIYRLQMTMKKMADGENPGPIRLRNGDHFSEVIEEYNRMIESRFPNK